ncbi:MAG: glycosyltransferase [Pontiella sp.]
MSQKLKIFFISNLGYGSSGLQRKTALQDLGHVITPFDWAVYAKGGSKITRSLRGRTAMGKAIRSLNADLVAFARQHRYDLVWIEKGIWFYPETVASLRGTGNAILLHYTPDPAITYHKTRHFIRSIPVYDVMVTTKRYELDKYRQHGAKHLILIGQAFDSTIHKTYTHSPEELANYQSDVCFIGHCEKHYLDLARAVACAANGLSIWGGPWERKIIFRPWLKRVYRGDNLWGNDYGKALSAAKIGLCFLTKLALETSTSRSIEIPACGTLLLAERTDEHLELFEEGKEAEFFDGKTELCEKIEYYLQHSDERERIAAAGRKRCQTSNYSNQGRLSSILNQVASLGLR